MEKNVICRRRCDCGGQQEVTLTTSGATAKCKKCGMVTRFINRTDEERQNILSAQPSTASFVPAIA